MKKYLALAGLMLASRLLTNCTTQQDVETHSLTQLALNAKQDNKMYVTADDGTIFDITIQHPSNPQNLQLNSLVSFTNGQDKNHQNWDEIRITTGHPPKLVEYVGHAQAIELATQEENLVAYRANIKVIDALPSSVAVRVNLEP